MRTKMRYKDISSGNRTPCTGGFPRRFATGPSKVEWVGYISTVYTLRSYTFSPIFYRSNNVLPMFAHPHYQMCRSAKLSGPMKQNHWKLWLPVAVALQYTIQCTVYPSLRPRWLALARKLYISSYPTNNRSIETWAYITRGCVNELALNIV